MRYLRTLAFGLSALSLCGCTPEPVDASRPAGDEVVALATPHAPIELIVILDTSMSMTRRQVELARSLLENLIQSLDGTDELSLVLLADEASIAIEAGYATPDAKPEWLRRIRAIEVAGLTDLENALELARSLASPETRVVLISDGSPTWGSVVPEELARLTEGLDLWAVGVGRHDRALLGELGRYVRLTDPPEIARAILTRDR